MKHWSIIISSVVLFSSCSVFKPGTKTSSGSTASTQHRVIENISVTPGRHSVKRKSHTPLSTELPPISGYMLNNVNIETLDPLQFKYAILLDIDVELMANTRLLEFMEEWYGTRYRYGGSTKNGVDCSFLTNALEQNVYGLALPRTCREQYEQCDKIDRTDLREGDLVFFNTRGGVSHVGVYLANNKFIHASTSSGVMISDLNEAYFSRRFLGGGRIRASINGANTGFLPK